MSIFEFIAFVLFWELLYSIMIPLRSAQLCYQRHKIYKADMINHTFMYVNLVAGLTSFFVFCLIQIFFEFYVEFHIGKLNGKYFALLFLYALIDAPLSLMFIVFKKRRML